MAAFDDPKETLFFDKEREVLTVAYGFGRLDVPDDVSQRFSDIIQSGVQETQAVVNFFNKVVQNPSVDSVSELLGFLENSNLPITEDGCFLAWKSVRSNYTDSYSGLFDNSIGASPEMPREDVNDNKHQTCSQGLHFCSIDYLKGGGFGSISNKPLMVIKINPADVVSIPTDYNNSKGRTCKYVVVGEVTGETKDTLLGLKTNQNSVWKKDVITDEEVDEMVDTVADLSDKGNASTEEVEELFDAMNSSLEKDRDEDSSKSDEALDVYMTVEGYPVTVGLVDNILSFINRFEETDMDNLKNLLLNKGIQPSGRMPSRVLSKLKNDGLLAGNSGSWRVVKK